MDHVNYITRDVFGVHFRMIQLMKSMTLCRVRPYHHSRRPASWKFPGGRPSSSYLASALSRRLMKKASQVCWLSGRKRREEIGGKKEAGRKRREDREEMAGRRGGKRGSAERQRREDIFF